MKIYLVSFNTELMTSGWLERMRLHAIAHDRIKLHAMHALFTYEWFSSKLNYSLNTHKIQFLCMNTYDKPKFIYIRRLVSITITIIGYI